ncbi:GNAT family N-acetyltransferase [Staphylococcus simiae]|uniref:N-acetyltransferase domain-containing protein n=1 Tax=Staphylococcus simiae CCM 7213 = CCUG 51256 TaxID=911238 RepID=G5JIS1_9STAP|nr:GNAT family N-acetyltransferase [Staphylococcus simiae]EHJ07924.1 hypothetical protein SS7213T_06796 [Staphylococcus simiae CCM 7213 = CCUG 51256]PNZ09702.1 N-acetyltransferase [Staphylococcus simiae]SNV65393.1 lactococcal prophage ps3 protein 05 [Staphylococcus simiae]
MNTIKTLTTDDYQDYRNLITSVKEEFTQDSQYSQTMTESLMKDILSKPSSSCNVFGYFDNNALIGTATLEQVQIVGKEHKSIIKFNFIQENDKDINSKLIKHIIQYAREMGYESVLASIVSNNISAKVFYSSLGFDNLGFEKNAIKINDDYFDEHWLIFDLLK